MQAACAAFAAMLVLAMSLALQARAGPSEPQPPQPPQPLLLQGCEDAPIWLICVRANLDVTDIDRAYRKHDTVQDYVAQATRAAQHKPVVSVFLKSDLFPAFVSNYLPALKGVPRLKGIVLVLGGGNAPAALPALVEDAFVQHIFVQNPRTLASSKVQPWPLGLDFHSLMKISLNGRPPTGWPEQWAELNRVATGTPRREDHYLYSCFRGGRANRDQVAAALKKNFRPADVYNCDLAGTDRLRFWQESRESALVVSPFGGEPDCHRTWEALYLDVPVVVECLAGLNPLYEQLQVICVEDWDQQFTRPWLEAQRARLPHANNRALLTSRYWIDLIDKHTLQPPQT